MVSSVYLRLLFLLAVLIPARASSSPISLMMYSEYKLNKQGDNIHPWCTPFPIWNLSIGPCPALSVASWLHMDFSGGRKGGLEFPTLEEFSTGCCDPHSQRLWHSHKAEVNGFLELSRFSNNPMAVENLISGSSAFSKLAWTSESS